MTRPGRGIARVVRGGILAAAGTSLAQLAHLGGGGSFAPMAVILVGIGMAGVCLVSAGRQRSFVEVLAALILAQLAFHSAFLLDAGHAASSVHAGTHPLGAGASLQALQGMEAGPMLAGHLVAALVTAWLLARGEAAVWRLARLMIRCDAWPRPVRCQVVTPVRQPSRRRRRAADGRGGGILLARAVRRRGPPVPLAA